MHHHHKPTYTFDQPAEYGMRAATAAANANTRKHRSRQHQRTNSEDADPTDGAGSLTYSAASSINSAGESTDSSFADIMKVLDLQDPQELGSLMKERGLTPAEYQMHLQHQARHSQQASNQRSSQASVTSSLQYSTDGESNFLAGTDIVSTITGQPSDSEGNDGGMHNNDSDLFDNLMFAPAEHADSLKKRKKEKRNKSRDASQSGGNSSSSTRPSLNNSGSGGSSRHQYKTSPSMSSNATSRQSDSTRNTVRHKNDGTNPPPPPRNPRRRPMKATIDDDICYAEWWMSCFPDAFKEMMPKR